MFSVVMFAVVQLLFFVMTYMFPKELHLVSSFTKKISFCTFAYVAPTLDIFFNLITTNKKLEVHLITTYEL